MGTPAADDLWAKVAAAVRAQLSEATWNTWFPGVHALDLTEDTMVLGVPSSVAVERIRTSYLGLLADAIHALTGVPLTVELLVDTAPRLEELVAIDSLALAPAPVATTDERPPAPEAEYGRGSTMALNPRYTFDQFVIGASNRFAHAAALSVAESPARSYNPLFIYGPAGLGKTHLLHAIGHHVRALFSSKRVRYVSTETMMNEFVEAMRSKTMPGFKRRYREVDVLLVDDIQFLERTEQLQEEFFYTFNDLHSRGSQIVISSDRPPKSIATIEDRLRSRFEWGLITDIQPPEFETRLAILRKKGESEHLDGIPDTVLAFIAENVVDNVRELEGSLIRVAAYSSLHRVPLTEEVAREVLADLLPGEPAARHHPRADPRGDGQDVRLDRRGPVRQEPAPAPRHRPADRHVRVPRAHRLQLSQDRRGVRWPGPHDGHARLREDSGPDGRAPRGVRAGQRAHQPDQARCQWITLWRAGEMSRRAWDAAAIGHVRCPKPVESCGRRYPGCGPVPPAPTATSPQSTGPTTTTAMNSVLQC